ncbi:hypothetical protein DES52_11821 [Deinococcus yavapaiensis KR-236]|uniref:Uncharacterized protein n=1 Tax=Deinococcus yavapaiensis KR-236 TaxID=694435 RepID=A0A318S1P6_9DEIO|nr:hypothetical protein DES52_11821 [Deinococcus yavapaiensis KR-236]
MEDREPSSGEARNALDDFVRVAMSRPTLSRQIAQHPEGVGESPRASHGHRFL